LKVKEEKPKHVDTLLIICNDKLREIYGNLKMTDAFGHADNILTTGAKGIAEIITEKLHVNTDFADIQTVLKDSGVAIMGSAEASGENRALVAVEKALNSPLLNDSNIKGARHVLLNVKCGSGDNEISMDEFGEITDFLQDAAGGTAEVIQGYGIDETLDNNVIVTIIATGFNNKKDIGVETAKVPAKKVTPLYGHPQPVAVQSEIIVSNEVKTSEKIVYEIDSKSTSNDEQYNSSPVEFSVTKQSEEVISNEVFFIEQPSQQSDVEPIIERESSNEDMLKKANERKERLKNFSWKIGKSINDLEGTPAYIRKNVQLDNVPHSSDSQISRYTLSEGEDKKAEIKPNNSFLHDNVD
jgi:cell division protein FtsZ